MNHASVMQYNIIKHAYIFHVIAFSKHLLINASYHRLALLCYHAFAVIVTLMSSWILSCNNDITLTGKEEKASRGSDD